MTRPPTAKRILRVAHKLFDREGAQAVTMRRVAELAGITPMAIYRHFPNRDALLKQLSDDSFNATAREWQALVQHPEPAQRLQSLFAPYLDYALRHPHLFDHAFLVRRDDARRFPDDFHARRSPTMNIAADTIAECMRLGVLKQDDPWAVAMSLSALQLGLIALYRAGRFNFDEAQFRAFCMQSMGRMLDGLKA